MAAEPAALRPVVERDLQESILDAIAPDYPLNHWDLTLETTISSEGGMVLYAVRLTNDSDRVIRRVVLRPALDEGIFGLDSKAKALGPIYPGDSTVVTFKLVPQKEGWGVGVDGSVLHGRDVGIKAVLKVRGGRTSYQLSIENRQKFSLRFLRVRAILPVDFVATEEEKEIRLLAAGETQMVEFGLIPRGHWEVERRHAASLKSPWIFSAIRPRRKRRAFPRAYSREEMGELRRKLLFIRADEELLRLIRDRPLDCGPSEVEFIIAWERHQEHGPIEVEFLTKKFHIGEPIDVSPLECPLDMENLYIEPIREFASMEEDFDIEHIAEVKPLDLEGTRAEEIEIEPMEMDI